MKKHISSKILLDCNIYSKFEQVAEILGCHLPTMFACSNFLDQQLQLGWYEEISHVASSFLSYMRRREVTFGLLEIIKDVEVNAFLNKSYLLITKDFLRRSSLCKYGVGYWLLLFLLLFSCLSIFNFEFSLHLDSQQYVIVECAPN